MADTFVVSYVSEAAVSGVSENKVKMTLPYS